MRACSFAIIKARCLHACCLRRSKLQFPKLGLPADGALAEFFTG
jgi:hypothetical protein